ncbi:dephospho-CoA kinase [Nocardioides korecus]
MIRVGLTGGVASGKSTVAALLVEQGAVLIDADALAREVVAAGTPGFDAVRDAFGDDLVGADGELDRAALGRLVFADTDARKRLEAIVHPLVFERMIELEQSAPADAVVVHDIPLLAERGPGGTDDFDAVVVVDAPEDLQVQRMTQDRGWTTEDARSRIAAQASREDRLAVATHVVGNTGTREELAARVHDVLAEITERHRSADS